MTQTQRTHAIPILLIDANQNFLRILSSLLREYYHQELHVIGTAFNNGDAVHQAQELTPRIILLGLDQHSLSSLQLIHRLRAVMQDVGIIVLGSLDIDSYRQAALAAGADAFVAKVALNSELLPAIRCIVGAVPPQDEQGA